MSRGEDVDVFKLYSYIQDLMTKHVSINDSLKELSISQPKARDFESLELSATAIVSMCEDMENSLRSNRCKCC